METTATVQQLNDALKHVNERFSNNIQFNRGPEQFTGKRVRFTLTVKDTKGPGGRLGHTGRRVKAACWHVHGYFFEYLFSQGVDFIRAGNKVMKDDYDNWQDWNIGSIASPMYYSEACECYKTFEC